MKPRYNLLGPRVIAYGMPRFNEATTFMDIENKCNYWKVLIFISNEGVGNNDSNETYLSHSQIILLIFTFDLFLVIKYLADILISII